MSETLYVPKAQYEAKVVQLNERIATLTAERDSAKRELAEIEADAEAERKKYEALREERDALAEKVERLETVTRCATEFADAIQTCHICAATLLIEDSPPHCLDCNGDCEYHDEPDCESLRVLLASLDAALLAARTTPPSKEPKQ